MKKRAFTLIELLVVIVIIGILVAIGVGTFRGYKVKATLAKGKAFERALVNHLLAKSITLQRPPIVIADYEEGTGTTTKDSSEHKLTFSNIAPDQWSTDTPDGSRHSLGMRNNNFVNSDFDQTQLTNQIAISGFVKPINLDIDPPFNRGSILFSGNVVFRMNQDLKPEFMLVWRNDSLTVEGDTSGVLGEWNHIAGTYDGETLRVYLNGELVGEKSASYTFSQSSYKISVGDTKTYNDNLSLHDRLRVFPFVPDEGFYE